MLHSFVIPVFNEELVIPELRKRLRSGLVAGLQKTGDTYEFLFIDDGSRDRSYAMLEAWQQEEPDTVRVLKFSRNFGHQTAITAGLDHAKGDTVTVLDADLQDPPEVILAMIAKYREGYDVVYGVREKRLKESIFKRLTASMFYRLLRASTGLDIPVDAGDFRLMSRRAVRALQELRERHRFVRGMSSWVGFKQTSVSYVREARFAGETKYPFKKMLRLSWDAFTGFSLAPLKIATYLGLGTAALSLIVGAWALYVRLFTDHAVQGWTSLIVVVLFLGGVQLFTVGILGEYVGRIFEEIKRRPLYLIAEAKGVEPLWTASRPVS